MLDKSTILPLDSAGVFTSKVIGYCRSLASEAEQLAVETVDLAAIDARVDKAPLFPRLSRNQSLQRSFATELILELAKKHGLNAGLVKLKIEHDFQLPQKNDWLPIFQAIAGEIRDDVAAGIVDVTSYGVSIETPSHVITVVPLDDGFLSIDFSQKIYDEVTTGWKTEDRRIAETVQPGSKDTISIIKKLFISITGKLGLKIQINASDARRMKVYQRILSQYGVQPNRYRIGYIRDRE